MYQLAKSHDYGVNTCQQCLAKQREIDRLTEENQRLRAKLAQQKRKDQEGFFGLIHTIRHNFPSKLTQPQRITRSVAELSPDTQALDVRSIRNRKLIACARFPFNRQ